MLNIELQYKQKKINIRCNHNEKIADVCNKYSNDINMIFDKKIFIFDGEKINIDSDLTFYEQIKKSEYEEDKHELLIYDDPDKCKDPKEHNNYKDKKEANTLLSDNENDASKILLKDEIIDAEENNNRNDEIMDENNKSSAIILKNESKVDQNKIKCNNQEKRKNLIKIYICLIFSLIFKVVMIRIICDIQIIKDNGILISIISATILLTIGIILGIAVSYKCECECFATFSYIANTIYNISFISLFSSLFYTEMGSRYYIFIIFSLLTNYTMIMIYFMLTKQFNPWILLVLFLSNGFIIIINLLSSIVDFWDGVIVSLYLFFQNIRFITFYYDEENELSFPELFIIFHYIFFILNEALCDRLCCDLWCK